MEKKIKQLTNNITNFERFNMDEVRKWADKNEADYFMQKINDAYSRLERWEKEYGELITTYPDADFGKCSAILEESRAELEQHKSKCEEKLAAKEYIEIMGRELNEMASYFAIEGDFYTNKLDLELREDNFTFADTEKLLATESDDYYLNQAKKNYEFSLKKLNNDDYIDGYYDFLDKKLSYETDKVALAGKFYDLFSLLQDRLFPENENLNDLLYYLNKLRGKAEEKQEKAMGDIIVSDFHSAHVNEVFFTDNETKPVKELTADDMKTRFQPGETIRCIAFLDNSFQNIYGKDSRAHFEVDTGYNWGLDAEEFTSDDVDKGYIDFKLATNGNDYSLPETASYSSVEKIMTALLDLPPRPKTLEVFVKSDGVGKGNSPQAELVGKFKIDGGDEDGLHQLKQNLKIVKAESLANERVPEPRMNDAELEQEILDFFIGLNWEETFKKTMITSDNYFAVKNDEGIAIARGLYVTMLSETDEGCFQQEFTVVQDQLGNDWSGFRLEGRGGKSEISCNLIK